MVHLTILNVFNTSLMGLEQEIRSEIYLGSSFLALDANFSPLSVPGAIRLTTEKYSPY